MKKAWIIALTIILGFVGFLAYDWHVKTTIQEDDQRVTLYSWTDENGAKHYTNTQPPDGAKNVEETKGFKYVEPPLVIKIKDKTIAMYKWIKEKLFKKKDRKKKKKLASEK
jgi:heme-degrading monooxygenase HmoA